MTREPLRVGLTHEQMDSLINLNLTMTALGDVLALAGSDALESHTLPTLGDAILFAGLEAREILDQVSEQTLAPGTGPGSSAGAAPPAPAADA